MSVNGGRYSIRHYRAPLSSEDRSNSIHVKCSCGAAFPSSAVFSGTICARISLTLRGESLGIRAQREHAEHAKQAKDVERDERRARDLSKLCEKIDHQLDGLCITDSNAIEKLGKMLVSVARELILRERVAAVPALNASLLRAFHIVSGREGFLRDASDWQQVLQVIGCLPARSSQCTNLCAVSAASTTQGDDDGIVLVSDIPANEEKEDEHALLKDALMRLKNQYVSSTLRTLEWQRAGTWPSEASEQERSVLTSLRLAVDELITNEMLQDAASVLHEAKNLRKLIETQFYLVDSYLEMLALENANDADDGDEEEIADETEQSILINNCSRGILFESQQVARILQLHATGFLTACSILLVHHGELQSRSAVLVYAANDCIPRHWGVDMCSPSTAISALRILISSVTIPVQSFYNANTFASQQQQYLYGYLVPPQLVYCAAMELLRKFPPLFLYRLQSLLSGGSEIIAGLATRVLGDDMATRIAEYAKYFHQRVSMVVSRAETCCHMVVRRVDVDYAARHYVHGEIRDGNGVVRGKVLYATGTKTPTAVVALDCDTWLHQRGQATNRCQPCSNVARIIQNARHNDRRRDGAPQFGRFLSVQHREALAKSRKELRSVISRSLPMQSAASLSGGRKGHLLPTSDEERFLRDVSLAVRNGRLPLDCWLARRMQHTIRSLGHSDLRAIRYTPEMIAAGQCLRFVGGSRTINELRGPIGEGAGNKGGHIPMNAYKIRNLEPSVSTLKAHSPPIEPYPILAGSASNLRAALDARQTPRVGGISFDAIVIAHGFTRIPHLHVLVGGVSGLNGKSGAIAAKDINLHSVAELRDVAGRQILQFFWTSLDGSVSVPLGYIVQFGDNPQDTFNAVCTIIKRLEEHDIHTVFTSSDGFCGSDDYVRRLETHAKRAEQSGVPLVHIFDYSHLLKNLRNHLLNNGFMCNGVFFSMKSLLKIWTEVSTASTNAQLDEATRSLNRNFVHSFGLDEINPSDKMNWESVKKLMLNAPEQLRRLRPLDPVASGLASYIEHMRDIYNAFSGDVAAGRNTSVIQRLEKLQCALEYFSKATGTCAISRELREHLHTTIVSLQTLVAWQQRSDNSLWPSRKACNVWLFLSTLIVENFFSIIRLKHRYPSLELYAVTYYAAYNYLVWRLSTDTLCPQFKNESLGKAYGNVEGIRFSFQRDYYYCSPLQKRLAVAAAVRANTCSDTSLHVQQEQRCLEIAEKLRPTRKVLTIREATCKKSADEVGVALLACPVADCTRIYKRRKCFEKHVQSHSNLGAGELIGVSTASGAISGGNGNKDEESEDEDEADDESFSVESVTDPWVVICVDVETTGLRAGNRIWQLAARCGDDCFTRKVRLPANVAWEAGAREIFRKSNSDLSSCDDMRLVGKAFLRWLRSCPGKQKLFVAYNANFDRRFLHDELVNLTHLLPGHSLPATWHFADALALARLCHPGKGKRTLEAMCSHFGIQHENPHDAMADVNATWALVRRLLFPHAPANACTIKHHDVQQRLLDFYALDPSLKTLPASWNGDVVQSSNRREKRPAHCLDQENSDFTLQPPAETASTHTQRIRRPNPRYIDEFTDVE